MLGLGLKTKLGKMENVEAFLIVSNIYNVH